MRNLKLGKRASKYLTTLQAKQARQLAVKLFELRLNPEPNDSKQLRGSTYRRADVGEHRIIYEYSEDILSVPLTGKRNDGDVYRRLDRLER
jgi:mRNA interferase RelE/StbE